MKIYPIGRGFTLAYFGGLRNETKIKPTIIFVRTKTASEPELFGKMDYSVPALTWWQKLAGSWFVFDDVATLKHWLGSMTEAINKLYPDEEEE